MANNAANSDAALQSAVLVGRIVVLSVAVLMLLPQIYIGIKGIRIAKKPDSSRAHIVWGIILIVLTAIRLLPPFLEFLGGQGETFGSFSEVCSIAVDVFVLFEYVKYAREVRNGV